MGDCPICGYDEYSKRDGCENCGHYDEYHAKRKLKHTKRDRRLDRRFR